MAEANQNRRSSRRRFVAAQEGLSRLEEAQRFRRVHPEGFEHFGREDLAHAAFEREAPIAPPRPWGPSAAFRPEVEQPPAIVQYLREEKASTVAEKRVVRVELVAVVAKRERIRKVVRQRFEAREVSLPFRIVEVTETDALGPPLVTKP